MHLRSASSLYSSYCCRNLIISTSRRNSNYNNENQLNLLILNGQKVSGENRNIKLRTTSHVKVIEWVSAINAVGQKHSESWFHPHRFNSFAPTRGLVEDGSLAQWFIDGKAAFEAIASSIEGAKSEVKFPNV